MPLPTLQQLDWRTGDIYRTDNGQEFTIIISGQLIEAFDADRNRHQFDLKGRADCKCSHGGLKHRVTGSVA